MPNKKISQFPLLSSPTGNVLFPAVASGTNYTVAFSAFTTDVPSVDNKHWESNVNKTIESDSTLVISGNYVLSGTNLTLNSDNLNLNISGIDFNKYAQIFIGGHLLLIDSNIINNGMISVGGGIIMSGTSTITGTGILI